MNLTARMLIHCALAASEKFYVEFKGEGEEGGVRPRHEYDTASAIYEKSNYLHSYTNFNIKNSGSADKNIELPFTKTVFDTLIGLLEDRIEDIPEMGPRMLHQLICEGELLDLTEGLPRIYRNLVDRSLKGAHREEILRANMNEFDSLGFPPAMLYVRLLRAHAEMCNTCVCVKGDTATVCAMRNEKYGSAEEGHEVRNVRILPLAFDRLLESREGGAAAAPGEGENADGWGVLAWILMQMEAKSLDMEGCKMDGGHVVPVARLGELRILLLKRCGLRGGDIQPIGVLTKLEELDVSYSVLSKDDASVVTSIGSLVRLRMHECHLRPDDLLHIGNLQLLEELDAGINSLGDKDISALALLPGLKRLYMSGCMLPRDKIRLLAGALQRLEELDVEYNMLSADDIRAISTFVSLIKLNVCKCGIEPNSLAPLGARQGLRELDVSNNALGSGNLQTVLSLTGLTRLNMCLCSLVQDNLVGIGVLQHLNDLNIGSNNPGSADISAIASLSCLIKLGMSFCDLQPDDLKPLAVLQHLEELDVSGCWLSESDIPKIASLIDLRT